MTLRDFLQLAIGVPALLALRLAGGAIEWSTDRILRWLDMEGPGA